jgi:hypothetical protein
MLAGTAYVAHHAGERSAERSSAESQQDERPADLGSQPQAAGSQPQAAGSQPQAAGSQPQAAGSQPQAAAESPLVAELSKLKGMLDAGVLNPQEFAAAKQKLLAG